MMEFIEVTLIILAVLSGINIGFSLALANDLKRTKKKLDVLKQKEVTE